METGPGSMADSDGSSTNSSTESLNGLKFGQKIYFENTPATGAGASGTTMGTPLKKGPGSSSSSGSGKKAPRCQVEGCKVDLSDAKAYYSRHKVCGMHSKASKVIVAGLEQRFCQQCSRFHQLPEFDQDKRSCRRRLAGHNERRRKPPPGSLLSSCYSRLSSPFLESSNRGGSFIMAYPRLSGREVWSISRANQNMATGRSLSLPHSWQNNSEDPPAGTGSSSAGECLTGVVDSNSALSLLSNQPWGSTTGVKDMINTEVSHGTVTNPYSNASSSFKGNNSGSSSHVIPPHLGLAQSSHQSRRQYMEDHISM